MAKQYQVNRSVRFINWMMDAHGPMEYCAAAHLSDDGTRAENRQTLHHAGHPGRADGQTLVGFSVWRIELGKECRVLWER